MNLQFIDDLNDKDSLMVSNILNIKVCYCLFQGIVGFPKKVKLNEEYSIPVQDPPFPAAHFVLKICSQ